MTEPEKRAEFALRIMAAMLSNSSIKETLETDYLVGLSIQLADQLIRGLEREAERLFLERTGQAGRGL